MINCKAILVDKHNFDEIAPQIIAAVQTAAVTGFDIETQNENAHEGVKIFRKENDAKAFDYHRMVVTGFSLYPELNAEEPVAYYINLNHADSENCLPWDKARTLLEAKPADKTWICHNAVYEMTVMKLTYDFDLDNYICTMQMAVSAYSPDEYAKQDWVSANFGAMKDIFRDADRLFINYDGKKETETPQQAELLQKVLAKSSVAKFSYNGVVKDLAYGYGLKKAVKSFFGHHMQSFKETLGDKRHMGELTGQQVVDYGAEDSYWAVKLFFHLYQFMKENNPASIKAFLEQENPMIRVYSEVRQKGMRVNFPNIKSQQEKERENFAQTLRELKAVIRELLPFPAEANERLLKYEKWYAGVSKKHPNGNPDNMIKYRKGIEDWANLPDYPDDTFKQCCQVSSPVSTVWAGKKLPTALSIGYYFQVRLLMYDLTRSVPIMKKGKIQSDAPTRGEMRERFQNRIKELEAADNPDLAEEVARVKLYDLMLSKMAEIALIEQRMKLYLNPYLNLTDQETGRMYPELSSLLASRRMSCSNPNAQQLAKRGKSTYVRGFYQADTDDELLVSIDWSQIELVLIGEFSGDKAFAEAYGQLPYKDLHIGAAAAVMGVVIPELTVDMLKNVAKMDDADIPAKLLVKPNGDSIDKAKARSFWRTEAGKVSNFNYWYSGALASVGEKLRMTTEQMWQATEAYRGVFPEAEAWRRGVIDRAKVDGYVQLPDGHRRTMWPASDQWATVTEKMFDGYLQQGYVGIYKFGTKIIKSVRSRSNNQVVNSLIQGSCATLAKRSVLGINKAIAESGLRASFKMAIHDELVFSVHRDDVIAFIHMAKKIMCHHPEIIKNLKIDATASIGRTFEPYDPKNPKMTQIEIDEAPEILGFEEGSKLNDDEIKKLIDYIFEKDDG